MNLFYANLARQIPSGTAPSPIDLIDGAVVQTSTKSFQDNGEADLDLQYAIALGKKSLCQPGSKLIFKSISTEGYTVPGR